MKRKRIKSFIMTLLMVFMSIMPLVSDMTVYAAETQPAAGTPYYIISNSNNLNVNMYVYKTSEIKNNTIVNLYGATKDDTQKFVFVKKGDGYLIQPNKVPGYTVNIAAVKKGAGIIAWKKNPANDEYWTIEARKDGFAFQLKSDKSLYLTANGKKLTLAKYSNSKKQTFRIVNANTMKDIQTSADITSQIVDIANEASNVIQDLIKDTEGKNVVFDSSAQYNIINKKNGNYMNLSAYDISEIKNKKTINLFSRLFYDRTQRFIIKKQDNAYLLQPCNTKYAVTVSSKSAGASVYVYEVGKAYECWIIEPKDDGYIFRLKNAKTLCLTAKGNKLTLAKYTGNEEQIFKISKAAVSQPVKEVGNGSVKLNVPTIRQTDPKWKDKKFAKNAKIGPDGCLLTSITAVMSYKDGTVYRPDEYCKNKDRLGFGSGGGLNKCQGWGYKGKFDLAFIKGQLDKGNPVVVGGKTAYGQHWVVVTGYKNGGKKATDYTIMDPSKQSSNLGQHISKYGSEMRYAK